MAQEEQNIACNRAPFVTDSSCSRGNVDTRQFLQFPICEVIDPIVPDFVQPTFDFPVVPFTPPPCACINIDLDGSGQLKDVDNVKIDFDFKANGDCCEGKYTGDLDITIPCIPFDLDYSSGSVDINITEVPCDETPEGTFNLGLRVEECKIVVDPVLNLKFPICRPPEINIEGDSSIDIEYVDCYTGEEPKAEIIVTESSGSGSNERNFTISAKIKIPYPEFKFGPSSGGDGSGSESSSDNVIINQICGVEPRGKISINASMDCDTITLVPMLELDLPPPPTISIEVDSSIGVEYTCDSEGGADITIDESGSSSCDKNFKISGRIRIPYPRFTLETDSGSSDNVSVRQVCTAESTDGVGGTLKITGEVDSGGSDCTRIKLTPSLDLRIPMPTEYQFEESAAVNVNVVDFACVPALNRKNSLKFETESSGCTKTVVPSLDLYVPCMPFDVESSNNRNINVRFQDLNDEKDKPGGTIGTEFVRKDCCTFSIKPTLDLVVPYPEPTILGVYPVMVDKFGKGKNAVWVVSIDGRGGDSDESESGSSGLSSGPSGSGSPASPAGSPGSPAHSPGQESGGGEDSGGCCPGGVTASVPFVTRVEHTTDGLVYWSKVMKFVKGCFVGFAADGDEFETLIIPTTPHINKCCGDEGTDPEPAARGVRHTHGS
jgi:hypothetical protein